MRTPALHVARQASAPEDGQKHARERRKFALKTLTLSPAHDGSGAQEAAESHFALRGIEVAGRQKAAMQALLDQKVAELRAVTAERDARVRLEGSG